MNDCTTCGGVSWCCQGTVCLDSGAYLANLAGCQGCGHKDTLKEANKTTSPSHVPQEVTEFDREYSSLLIMLWFPFYLPFIFLFFFYLCLHFPTVLFSQYSPPFIPQCLYLFTQITVFNTLVSIFTLHSSCSSYSVLF